MKISAVIITLNEAQHIDKCIRSIKPIADEIIIVDSYSTDETATICKKHGVKFVQRSYDGQIEQKQFALSLTSHDWVISLDGDEALDDDLQGVIMKIKATEPEADAFRFCRKSYYCGHWIEYGGWHPEWKLRFWDKKMATWGGINPHDRVIPSSGAKVIKLKGKLLHYTFTTAAEHIEQEKKYAKIDSLHHSKLHFMTAFIRGFSSATFKWIKDYLFRLGFLDGRLGWQIALITAYGKYKKYMHRAA